MSETDKTKAFPIDLGSGDFHEGMDLRDYIAAKVIASLVIARASYERGVTITREDEAAEAYRMADAMMEARRKP